MERELTARRVHLAPALPADERREAAIEEPLLESEDALM